MSTGTDLPIEVWPTSQGDLHFPVLDGSPSADAAASVLSQLAPGSAVVLGDVGVRDRLMESGAQQVRHVLTMKRAVADPWVAPDVPGLRLREWQSDDAALLAPALVGAYDAQHPDPANPDLAVAAQTLWSLAEDPANPRMRATTVAELSGRPVGVAFVQRCEHVTGWKGPCDERVPRAQPRGCGGRARDAGAGPRGAARGRS